MVFELCDVKATGLKSLSTLVCGFFGMGMRQDVFHSAGTFPSWRLRLKRCCRGSPSYTAHALKSGTDSIMAGCFPRAQSPQFSCDLVRRDGRGKGGGSVWSPGGGVQHKHISWGAQ